MENIRIAVLCGGPFAFPVLMKLAVEKFLCGLVVATANQQVASNLQSEAANHNFAFLHVQSRSDMPDLENWLKEVKPDAVFSICFPYKIPASSLSLVPNRIFNFHPGPLPAYRGPSPIFEVLKRGEKETAIAVHFMTEGYDEGNIVFTEKVKIEPNDHYETLTLKLSSRCGIAAMNLAEMLNFGSGKFEGTKQDESKSVFHPFPKEKDLEIKWNEMPATQILSLIKACHSWSRGAITWLGDEMLRIPDAEIFSEKQEASAEPGTIIRIEPDGSCLIACLGGEQIKVSSFNMDFGNPGIEYLRSIGLSDNSVLGKINFDTYR